MPLCMYLQIHAVDQGCPVLSTKGQCGCRFSCQTKQDHAWSVDLRLSDWLNKYYQVCSRSFVIKTYSHTGLWLIRLDTTAVDLLTWFSAVYLRIPLVQLEKLPKWVCRFGALCLSYRHLFNWATSCHCSSCSLLCHQHYSNEHCLKESKKRKVREVQGISKSITF